MKQTIDPNGEDDEEVLEEKSNQDSLQFDKSLEGSENEIKGDKYA